MDVEAIATIVVAVNALEHASVTGGVVVVTVT